jgi:cytochrome c
MTAWMSILAQGHLAAPRDLPLPLPLPAEVLALLIVPLFLLHILFVNLTVGGSALAVLYEIVGLYVPRYDRLARVISNTVTVNKSLAVVLGIGPLLLINLLYTTAWYSANTLTGHAWVLLLPMLIVAFLLAYLHKYTWDTWRGARKARHIVVGGAAAALFLTIPLIFLTNVNLMLFPERWREVTGFFASLRVGNVFPRYLHFVCATLAVTALYLAAIFRVGRVSLEALGPDFSRAALVRHFYRWTLFVTSAQFLVGPLLLLTLPSNGLSNGVLGVIGLAVIVALAMLVLLQVEVAAPDAEIGRHLWPIVGLFSIVVLGMGQGRHLYRVATLEPFHAAVEARTAQARAIELGARMEAGRDGARKAIDYGVMFDQTCAACHGTRAVLAPALEEIGRLYGTDVEGVVTWAKAPGRKRTNFGPMPPFAHLSDADLRSLAAEMLRRARPGGVSPQARAVSP